MNGMPTNSNITFIEKSQFDKNIVIQLNDYVFIYYKHVNEKSIVKVINLWKNKYNNFGLIISSKGILIDCSQYNFHIEDKTNIVDDLYYQSIANGIISIRDEYINNYI